MAVYASEDLLKLQKILAEILDINIETIQEKSYLVRDLGTDSLDFFELAVEISNAFNIEVVDDVIFLKKLRPWLAEARKYGNSPELITAEKYQHLTAPRILEMLGDLDGGPVLQVRDLLVYVQYKKA